MTIEKRPRGASSEYNKAYYLAHKEEILARVQAYHKTDRGREARRRAVAKHNPIRNERKKSWNLKAQAALELLAEMGIKL